MRWRSSPTVWVCTHGLSRGALEQVNCKEEPPVQTLHPLPPPLLSDLKRVFFGAFGAHVLCVPQGHVQGVSQLFTLSSISMKMDCHELILSYCGHRFCHKVIALSSGCTVSFVDKEEGQPSMGFCYAKKIFSVPLSQNMFGGPVGKEDGQPPTSPGLQCMSGPARSHLLGPLFTRPDPHLRGAIRTLTLFSFFYYGIHSLMFGGGYQNLRYLSW